MGIPELSCSAWVLCDAEQIKEQALPSSRLIDRCKFGQASVPESSCCYSRGRLRLWAQ